MRKLTLAVFALALTFSFALTNVSAQDDMKSDEMKSDQMKKDEMKKDDKKDGRKMQKMQKMQKSDNPMVGGAAMFKNKDIIDNAVNSADHTTLVAAVKAAGLVETLKGKGPFTVFAPENSAFDALPDGTVPTLLEPENKDMLTKILTYHVVAGKYDSKKIMKAIKKGNGKAMLTTVQGGMLTAMMNGDKLVLTDEKGGTSTVTIADVKQSNGYIHSIDSVLMPN